MKFGYASPVPISFSLLRASDNAYYNFGSSAWDAPPPAGGPSPPPVAAQLRAFSPLGAGASGGVRVADIPTFAGPTLGTRPGSYGSFRFTGSSYHVGASAPSALGPPTAFTWACWARRRGAVQPNSTLVGLGRSTTDVPLLQLRVDDATGTHFGVCWRDNAGHIATILGTARVDDPGWHHAAVTCDGATLTLYTDGQPDGTASLAGIGATTVDRLCFGGLARTSLTCPFAGELQDVRGYGRALAAAEVAATAQEWLGGPAGSGDVQIVVWTTDAGGQPVAALDVIPLAVIAPSESLPGGMGS